MGGTATTWGQAKHSTPKSKLAATKRPPKATEVSISMFL